MSTPLKQIILWGKQLFALFFPEHCTICNKRLPFNEHCICATCFAALPFTHCNKVSDPIIERIFLGKFNLYNARSLLLYHRNTPSIRPILNLKYFHRPSYGIYMGIILARLIPKEFFENIDYIIPIPITKQRFRQRGYNQAYLLAKGIEKITHIPIAEKTVSRKYFKQTQTRLSPHERLENVRNAFHLDNPQLIKDKHILIIDDVLTTGSTIISFAQTIEKNIPVRISVLTLYLAGTHRSGTIVDSKHAVKEYFY